MTLVPYIEAAGELKTKPTQHSVRALRDIGIQPDVIVCRTGKKRLGPDQRAKIALFCNVTDDAIINAEDMSPLYAIPLNFKSAGPGRHGAAAAGHRRARRRPDRMDGHGGPAAGRRQGGAHRGRGQVCRPRRRVQEHQRGALSTPASHNDCKVNLDWVDSEQFEKLDVTETVLAEFDGIVVGRASARGASRARLTAVQYARENKVPYFGICLGMQIAVIELARHVAGLTGATSTEFDPETPHPVICLRRSSTPRRTSCSAGCRWRSTRSRRCWRRSSFSPSAAWVWCSGCW